MSWYSDYIGLPFEKNGRTRKGLDCYGLVCLIYDEHLGIGLNHFVDIFKDDKPETYLHIAKTMQQDRINWATADRPQRFDMIQFRTGKHAFHVGIAIDSKRFLHVEDGITSEIQYFNDPLWRNRVEWIFRHKLLDD